MLSQPVLLPPPEVTMNTCPDLPAACNRRARADILVVPIADDAAEVGVLLQHRLGDRARLGGIIGRGLIGDDLDLRVVGEDVIVGVELVEVGGRGRLALEDGDLARLARPLAAMVDERLRLDQANLHPVGADVSVGRIDRLEIDLQHLDAGLDRALLKLGVGLEVGIVDDQRDPASARSRR